MSLQIIIQLITATVLGGLIGIEREYKRKEAGLRTYSLICLGAAFFTIISFEIFRLSSNELAIGFSPIQTIGQIILGVGFLGAGLIVLKESHLEGLTTAAGLWVTGGVGIAVGAGLYFEAIFVAFLAIAILAGLRFVEEKAFKKE
jgi:putative Mg2+ transporter-C (MgtC) family protein